jgi:CheY-like chemotaxis protein
MKVKKYQTQKIEENKFDTSEVPSPSIYKSKNKDVAIKRKNNSLLTKPLQPNMGDMHEKKVYFNMSNFGDSSSSSSRGAENWSITWIEGINKTKISHRFKNECGCPTILIVDDQYINRFIIQQFWDQFSINSAQVEDGQEAIEFLLGQKKICWNGISLVLMDLNMPVLGGIEASIKLSKLKNERRLNNNMRIVAVTAFPSESVKENWYAAGISQFFVKPFTIFNFIELISE